jgi:hypothetical protein
VFSVIIIRITIRILMGEYLIEIERGMIGDKRQEAMSGHPVEEMQKNLV